MLMGIDALYVTEDGYVNDNMQQLPLYIISYLVRGKRGYTLKHYSTRTRPSYGVRNSTKHLS